MEHATKYYCKTCSSYKWIPERPLQAKRTISTGCDNCARIRTHKAVGVGDPDSLKPLECRE